MNKRLYDIRKSFVYALNGIAFCIRYEKNMRIHVTAMLYILFFSQFYELERAELLILILTSASVITLETVNTSIEVVVDKVSPKYHTLAKIAKDVAAGAVLISSIAAVIVGLILFFDVEKFVIIINVIVSQPSNIALFVASVIFSIIFIGSGKKRRASTPVDKAENKNDE